MRLFSFACVALLLSACSSSPSGRNPAAEIGKSGADSGSSLVGGSKTCDFEYYGPDGTDKMVNRSELGASLRSKNFSNIKYVLLTYDAGTDISTGVGTVHVKLDFFCRNKRTKKFDRMYDLLNLDSFETPCKAKANALRVSESNTAKTGKAFQFYGVMESHSDKATIREAINETVTKFAGMIPACNK